MDADSSVPWRTARRAWWLGLGALFALVGFVVLAMESPQVAWLPFAMAAGCVWLSFGELAWEPLRWSSALAGAAVFTAIMSTWPESEPTGTLLVSREFIVDRYAGPQGQRPGTSGRWVLVSRGPRDGGVFLQSAVMWEWVRDRMPREVEVTRQGGRILRVALVDGSASVTFEREPNADPRMIGGLFAAAILVYLWENQADLT